MNPAHRMVIVTLEARLDKRSHPSVLVATQDAEAAVSEVARALSHILQMWRSIVTSIVSGMMT